MNRSIILSARGRVAPHRPNFPETSVLHSMRWRRLASCGDFCRQSGAEDSLLRSQARMSRVYSEPSWDAILSNCCILLTMTVLPILTKSQDSLKKCYQAV